MSKAETSFTSSEPAEIRPDTTTASNVDAGVATVLEKCKGFFTEETYRVLASLVVPLLLITVIFSMIGKKMLSLIHI